MAEEHKFILHGVWASSYSKRAEIALKVKGIPFEFVEEDLINKSALLLKYNPIHKKIPVLVHNGKPIAESLTILEYIDEVWKSGPRLLPEEPYERAQVRFWGSFFQHQVFETIALVVMTDGETQEKAIPEHYEKLRVLEEGMKELFPYGSPFDEKQMGILDILLLSTFGAYKAQEQALGLKVINPEKNPLIFSRINSLINSLINLDERFNPCS